MTQKTPDEIAKEIEKLFFDSFPIDDYCDCCNCNEEENPDECDHERCPVVMAPNTFSKWW